MHEVAKGFITGYKGIQGDTNFYRRSDGVTGGYRGLQWVTRGLQDAYFSNMMPPRCGAVCRSRLGEELQSVPKRCLDIIGISRTFLPTLEGR